MAKVKSKDWRNLPVSDWNTLSFTEYLKDKHVETFNLPYVPLGGWRAEQGMIAEWIGTASGTRKRKYENYIVKNFIDRCFETYVPCEIYPGTSFGFSYSYRRQTLQQVLAEDQANEKYKEAVENHMPYDDIADLL